MSCLLLVRTSLALPVRTSSQSLSTVASLVRERPFEGEPLRCCPSRYGQQREGEAPDAKRVRLFRLLTEGWSVGAIKGERRPTGYAGVMLDEEHLNSRPDSADRHSVREQGTTRSNNLLQNAVFGKGRSLVSRPVRDREIAGSNPACPR